MQTLEFDCPAGCLKDTDSNLVEQAEDSTEENPEEE